MKLVAKQIRILRKIPVDVDEMIIVRFGYFTIDKVLKIQALPDLAICHWIESVVENIH